MRVVISQPMFLPWYGHFDLMRHADIFVHYDDAQLPGSSSFMTRVQIKTSEKATWLSLPIDRSKGSLNAINASTIMSANPWRKKHVTTLKQSLSKYDWAKCAFKLIDTIYSNLSNNLSEFNIFATECIADYLKISPQIMKSSEMNFKESKSNRVLKICMHLGATEYISAHGGMNYLDHELFERNGINIKYMNYQCEPYAQGRGNFTPYISILDMIAACGPHTTTHMCSTPLHWSLVDCVQKKK